MTGLTNGKLYTLRDCVVILNAHEGIQTDPDENSGSGGAMKILLPIVITVAAIGVVAGLLVFVMHRKKRTSAQ